MRYTIVPIRGRKIRKITQSALAAAQVVPEEVDQDRDQAPDEGEQEEAVDHGPQDLTHAPVCCKHVPFLSRPADRGAADQHSLLTDGGQ
jgi:hypothetical protein